MYIFSVPHEQVVYFYILWQKEYIIIFNYYGRLSPYLNLSISVFRMLREKWRSSERKVYIEVVIMIPLTLGII